MSESQPSFDAQAFDSRDRSALEGFRDELEDIYGALLLAVAVTGEAASSCYRPRRTPLQTVVIVSDLNPAVLRAARPSLRAWARKRIPTPLFFDPTYLEGALDAFPLEFREIADFYFLLYGDASYFESIRIDQDHLRRQVEEQLRGKLIHLWEHYLVSGGKRRDLERLLIETLPGFEVPMRGMLRLRDPNATDVVLDRPVGVPLIEAVAEELSLALPTMKRLESVRLSGERLSDPELDLVFEDYLEELRQIIARIDQF
jgi:hypothetical protein